MNDFCGWSVSLSADGKRLAIGASQNDGNGSDAGHEISAKIKENIGYSDIQQF